MGLNLPQVSAYTDGVKYSYFTSVSSKNTENISSRFSGVRPLRISCPEICNTVKGFL